MNRFALYRIISDKINEGISPGKDGITGALFLKSYKEETDLIIRKFSSKSYNFTPYLENILHKGKGKYPRVISKTTIRDKVVLTYLHKELASKLKGKFELKLPVEVIRSVSAIYDKLDPTNYSFIKLDIKAFYDTIPISKLLQQVKPYISDKEYDILVKSLTNHTQNFNENKKSTTYCSLLGIPQGLPTSNILASFYLNSFDAKLKNRNFYYFRYVDDILIFCTNKLRDTIFEYSKSELGALGLKLNEKSHSGNIYEEFDFLGYSFNSGVIGIGKSKITKFLRSVFSQITKAENTKKTGLWGGVEIKKKYINILLLQNINLKVAGAVRDSIKYGWIAYYSQTQDLRQLFAIDRIIEKKLLKLGYKTDHGIKLKKVSRAYKEFTKNPENKYSLNYNNITSQKEKLDFLSNFGVIGAKHTLTAKEISSLFQKTVSVQIKYLEKDVGRIS